MLLFKKKFLAAIRAGTKTQTVRLWKYQRMRAGQQSYIPGIGRVAIEAVDRVKLSELTTDDARLDGFPSKASLRRELKALYPPELRKGYQAYRIRFRLGHTAPMRTKGRRPKRQ